MSGDKGKVVAGVFIGMVLGVAAAAGVAWYVLEKKPAAFINNKDMAKSGPQAVPALAAVPAFTPVSAPVAASGVAEAQQHFEFYKVLTDKSDGAARKATPGNVAPRGSASAKIQPVPTAAASNEMYYLQAGSFQNVGDAEKLKAKLAFSGYEASVQTVSIPDKGEWHRVRLGPYSNSDASKTIAALKQDGITATQLHAQ